MSNSPVPRLKLENMSSVGRLIHKKRDTFSKIIEENYDNNLYPNKYNPNSPHNQHNQNLNHYSSDSDEEPFADRRRRYPARRRHRLKTSDKIEIIRKSFRQVSRDPAMKMQTLTSIRLQFGKPNKDGTMQVSTNQFRASIPQLLNIVSVDARMSLTPSEIDTLIEEIDLNRDGNITYGEFVNFIAFKKSKLRRIARVIQQKLSHTVQTDAQVQQLFRELSAKNHRTISVDKFQEMLSQKLNIALHPGEVKTLVQFLDLDQDGSVNYNEFVRFIRDHGLQGRSTGVFEGTTRHRPVVDIVLSFSAKDEVKYSKLKYEKQLVNLNHGTYGKEIHLWLLREESKTGFKNSLFSSAVVRKRPELKYPICEIRIDTKDNSSSLYADGFTCIDGSTNSGWFNWGTDMYLWIRRDYKGRESTINDIHLTSGHASDSASKIYDIPSRGYRRLEVNLNHGTRGHDVFLWYHKVHHGETPRSKFSKTLPLSHLITLTKKSKRSGWTGSSGGGSETKKDHHRRWQTTAKELDELHQAIAKRARYDIRLKATELATAARAAANGNRQRQQSSRASGDDAQQFNLTLNLKTTFSQLNGKHKKSLHFASFRKMLTQFGCKVDQSTSKRLFKEVDYSNTGSITFEDFQAFVTLKEDDIDDLTLDIQAHAMDYGKKRLFFLEFCGVLQFANKKNKSGFHCWLWLWLCGIFSCSFLLLGLWCWC